MFLPACKSGKKSLKNGNYDEAFHTSVKRLKQNPGSKRAEEVLLSSYKMSMNFHQKEIERHKGSDLPEKYDQIVVHYRAINAMYLGVQNCPACLELIPNAVYLQEEEKQARLEGSKYHYSEGIKLMELKTMDDSRAAYRHFLTAKDYTPQYDKVDEWIRRSKYEGTLHVLVRMVPVSQNRYALSSEFFRQKIMENLNAMQYTFVRFYSENEASNAPFGQVITLSFDDFSIGDTYVKETVNNLSKDSVKVGETGSKEAKIPVYGTVKATLRVFEKSVMSSGVMDMTIFNTADGAVLRQDKLPGSYNWFCSWATFNGDERALSKEQLNLTKSREMMPPPPQDMFVYFTGPIYNQIIRIVRNQYQYLQ